MPSDKNSPTPETPAGLKIERAGNMTHDASHSYAYDAENRLTAVDGGNTLVIGAAVAWYFVPPRGKTRDFLVLLGCAIILGVVRVMLP